MSRNAMSMSILFVVLHFKDSAMTKRCIDSVLQEATDDDMVLVVDASHDFTADLTYNEIITINKTPQHNPGFARAMNWGAQEYSSNNHDFICFVNNDTVMGDGFRKVTLSAFLENIDNIAAVGPKIVHLQEPNIIWSAGGYISRLKMTSVQEKYFCDAASVQGTPQTDFLSGCVITIKKKDFEEIGGWPDAYLFGGEEWELSTRLRRKGKLLIIASDSIILHEADIDSGQGKSHSFSDLRFVLNSYLNRILYADNNHSLSNVIFFRVYLLFYIITIMPFRWRFVGATQAISAKFLLCLKIGFHIMLRPRSKPITWDELSAFAAHAGNSK